MSLAIRSRLTLWYAGVLSVLLAAFAVGLFGVHRRTRLGQFDDELDRTAGLVAGLVAVNLDEGLPLPEASADALEDVVIAGRSRAVFDATGVLLAGDWEGLPLAGAAPAGPRGARSVSVDARGGRFRVHRSRHVHGGAGFEVGVAESVSSLEAELAALRRTMAGGVVLTLVLAVGGGWWLARAALRPVETMAADARGITGRTPGLRLVSPNPGDELAQLALAFNGLLDRLEKALAEQRQFMADASHELRTPVSVSRTAIDVTLGREGRSEDEYRESLVVVREQMRRLTRIVDDLFTLARADAAGLPLDRRPLYLDELVAEGVREWGLLAATRGVAIERGGPPEIEIWGDERLLGQMLGNLLDNAVRHSPAGARVRVDAGVRGDSVELAVTDEGPGIAEADRERIFTRFVRLGPENRRGDGAGLGLPIARAIAEAHGGALVLARSDASGSTFLARLPRPSATE